MPEVVSVLQLYKCANIFTWLAHSMGPMGRLNLSMTSYSRCCSSSETHQSHLQHPPALVHRSDKQHPSMRRRSIATSAVRSGLVHTPARMGSVALLQPHLGIRIRQHPTIEFQRKSPETQREPIQPQWCGYDRETGAASLPGAYKRQPACRVVTICQ